ncbi:hypothetical protein ACFQVC_35985, partial [Streptomyces monticola]
MTDSSGAPPEPDFLDRLLARHLPAGRRRPDVVRVRPRLTGPFERVDAVGATAREADGTVPLWPTSPEPRPGESELTPATREVRLRTERERTVVRTEREPAPETDGRRPAAPPPAPTPLLRPAAAVAPWPRPVPDVARGA